MKCQFCGRGSGLFAEVPARGKFGSAIKVPACIGCAIENGIYCTKHDKPHQGFVSDNTTACLFCIEDEVKENREAVERVYQRLEAGLPNPEWVSLLEEVEINSVVTCSSDQESLYSLIVARAHRSRIPVEDVVLKILEKKSAMIILPSILLGGCLLEGMDNN